MILLKYPKLVNLLWEGVYEYKDKKRLAERLV